MSTTKPSREEVLLAAVESGFAHAPPKFKHWRGTISDLERFAAAMYAKGAEDMRERAAVAANGFKIQSLADGSNVYAQAVIRALPITPNTEGEQG